MIFDVLNISIFHGEKKNDSAMASRPGDVAACRQAALEGVVLGVNDPWFQNIDG